MPSRPFASACRPLITTSTKAGALAAAATPGASIMTRFGKRLGDWRREAHAGRAWWTGRGVCRLVAWRRGGCTRLAHAEPHAATFKIHIDDADPYDLPDLDDILDALHIAARTELRYVDQTIHTAKIDERAKLGDAGDLALAPLTDDQRGNRLLATAVALLAGDIRLARRGSWWGMLHGISSILATRCWCSLSHGL